MSAMISRRLPLLLAAALLTGGASSASARLGETREECIARYGEPVAAGLKPRLQGAGSLSFVKNRVRIWVEFLDEKAVFISFSQRGMKSAERQQLLDLNKGDLIWGNPEKLMGRDFWLARPADIQETRHATAYKLSEIEVLDLALQPWVDAMKAQKAAMDAAYREGRTADPAAVEGTVATESPTPAKQPSGKPAAPPSSMLDGF